MDQRARWPETGPAPNLTETDWAGLLQTGNSRWVGSGLLNLGHTSFLNAVLQCLSHTPPTLKYPHRCRESSFCPLCALRRLAATPHPASPELFVQHLKYFGRDFRRRQTSDPFEFLSAVLSKTSDRKFIEGVFGSQVRSLFTCNQCHGQEVTLSKVLHFSLELNTDTVQNMVGNYFQERECERKCQHCEVQSGMSVKSSLGKAPLILVLHLQRYPTHTDRITSRVAYEERLTIPVSGCAEHTYELYAVLLHSGATATSGHSSAFVLTGSANWYRMNDTETDKVEATEVLSHHHAYILFYKLMPAVTPNYRIMQGKTLLIDPSRLSPGPANYGELEAGCMQASFSRLSEVYK